MEVSLPKVLQKLFKDNGCYARIIGELHPNEEMYTILIHATVLFNIFKQIKASKETKHGQLFGWKDDSRRIVEVTGSSVFRQKEGQLLSSDLSLTDVPIGSWVVQEGMDDQAEGSDGPLQDAGWLVLKLPLRFETLLQAATRYGAYIKEDTDTAHTGPVGFLIIERKKENQTGRPDNVVKLDTSAIDGLGGTNSSRHKEPAANSPIYNKEKIKVATPIKQESSLEGDIKITGNQFIGGGKKKIKIEKQILERFSGLPFLNFREYSTPGDYTYTLQEYRERLFKCDESLFIEKDILEKIVRRPKYVIRNDIYRFTYLEGHQKNMDDHKIVFYVDSANYRVLKPEEIEHPEKFIDRRYGQVPIDPRSKFNLRVWCAYTSHELLYTLDSLTIFNHLLKYLDAKCTQVGLIMSTREHDIQHNVIFDSGAFKMVAFIKKVGADLPEYFSEEKFFLIGSGRNKSWRY